MRQLVPKSAPTISTVRQQTHKYTSARSPRLRLCSANSIHSCISYTLSPSHIYLPLSGYNLCSRKTPHLSHFYQTSTPPLIRIDFPYSRIPSLLLGLHSSHWIHTTPLLYSLCCQYHPPTHPYSRPVSFSHSSAICPCRFPGIQRYVHSVVLRMSARAT